MSSLQSISSRARALIAAAVALASSSVSYAAGTGGCDSFDWPLATEIAWMTAAKDTPVASGTAIGALPEKAVTLALTPQASARLAAEPSGKPKSPPAEAHAGAIVIQSLPAAGQYQISLSGPGWIDAIQNGAVVPSGAHTGKSDCAAIRKSVRFDLAAAPVTLQVTNAPANTIKIAIRRSDDTR